MFPVIFLEEKTNTHIHTHINTYTHIHTHTHTHTHTYIYTHIYTHIYIYLYLDEGPRGLWTHLDTRGGFNFSAIFYTLAILAYGPHASGRSWGRMGVPEFPRGSFWVPKCSQSSRGDLFFLGATSKTEESFELSSEN